MKNTLAYARVSTSVPAQLKAIRERASSHGFRILEESVDEVESAKTVIDRPSEE